MYACIGLGSNLGDRAAQLRRAVAAIGGLGAVRARSAVYETAPVGGPPQPRYLNAALWLETPLEPLALLAALQAIEAAAGRVRVPGEQNAPRPLDLDILLLGRHGELVVLSDELTVPHPRLHQRVFALLPVLDLAPELTHPALGVPLRQLCDALLSEEPAPHPVGWL